MSEEAAFLEALKANPADDVTRLVYADWLDEHDQPHKAEYLRLIASVMPTLAARGPDPAVVDRITTLLPCVSPEWRLTAGMRFGFVLHLSKVARKVEAIKLVRELTEVGLREAKDFVETPPRTLPISTTFESAIGLQRRFGGALVDLPHARPTGTTRAAVTFWAYVYLAQRGMSGDEQDTPPNDALVAFRAFLIAALGIPDERADELAHGEEHVRLADGWDYLTLEPRLRTWEALASQSDHSPEWAIRLNVGYWLTLAPSLD